MKKIGTLMALVLWMFLMNSAVAGTLHVCEGCTYPSYPYIQSAIDNAMAGDNILVLGGVYHENVIIDKKLTLIGASAEVDAGFRGSAITLDADNITLQGFTVKNSGTDLADAGIAINSNGNVINRNIAENNTNGIFVSSKWNTIKDNIVSSNENGIYLFFSNKNELSGNDAISNRNAGIYSYNSGGNQLESNSADSNDIGMSLDASKNNSITGSNLTNNREGAHATGSDNNYLNNNMIQNNEEGFYFESSVNNYIYNNLLNNVINAYDDDRNSWNNSRKAGTNIMGGRYIGGNYWSDYPGVDSNGDGLGDVPYPILGGKGTDYLPLVYNIPFDTGEGGYPSIPGIHKGTIILNQDLTVSSLYTYPNPGTGGHTEYVRLENSTWSVTARWGGYNEDWHNIAFGTPFKLYANKIYNYTIVTGSYPQIIHAGSLTTSLGTITSAEFKNANGISYTGWIPAIRLGS